MLFISVPFQFQIWLQFHFDFINLQLIHFLDFFYIRILTQFDESELEFNESELELDDSELELNESECS